jgi:hypothetical protein
MPNLPQAAISPIPTMRERVRSLRRSVRARLHAGLGVRAEKPVAPHLFHSILATYGFADTLATGKAIDARGDEIPWITYPALEYINSLDLGGLDVFEWGSGHSSTFFSARARTVVSVESNPEWYDYGRRNLAANQRLLLREGAAYAAAIREVDGDFGFIVIDGILRSECAREAVGRLAPGGVILLDNADWWTKTAAFLRSQGLVQIDFHGFGPINQYSWTTALLVDPANSVLATCRKPEAAYSMAAIRQTAAGDF